MSLHPEKDDLSFYTARDLLASGEALRIWRDLSNSWPEGGWVQVHAKDRNREKTLPRFVRRKTRMSSFFFTGWRYKFFTVFACRFFYWAFKKDLHFYSRKWVPSKEDIDAKDWVAR